jgi:hypothetical protein
MGSVHIAPDGAGILKAGRISPETKLLKLERGEATGAFARLRPEFRAT